MTQRRWLCATCQREWISNASAAGANPWAPEDGCPGCHSSQVREVEYRPAFPGADIPRELAAQPNQPALPAPSPSVVVQAPPAALEYEAAPV